MVQDDARPIPKREIPFFHLVPLSIFLIVNAALILTYRPAVPLEFFTPFTLLVFGLAAYRIADIIANEQVTKVIRAPFVNVKEEAGKEVETPKRRGWKETMGSLLYCPSCVGVWVAAFLVYLYIFAPELSWLVVAVFALSALERIFQNVVSLLDRLKPGQA
jgi:O-antigen ligase